MRRTLGLLAFLAVGVVLVVLVDPPRRLTPADLARGPRVVRGSAHAIRRVEATLGERRFVAERTHEGWRVDGVPASARLDAALDALATELTGLRAVDAFPTTRFADFGLEPPAGTLVVTMAHETQRLALGKLNAAGSAVYARRGVEPRVLQVGVYVLETVERVLAPDDEHAARRYRPEIG